MSRNSTRKVSWLPQLSSCLRCENGLYKEIEDVYQRNTGEFVSLVTKCIRLWLHQVVVAIPVRRVAPPLPVQKYNVFQIQFLSLTKKSKTE